MALKTTFTVGGKTYVRNSGNDGADVEVFGIRITRWVSADGDQLTGETRWHNGKPLLMVTEGDATLYKQLERLFWKANVEGVMLPSVEDTTGHVH